MIQIILSGYYLKDTQLSLKGKVSFNTKFIPWNKKGEGEADISIEVWPPGQASQGIKTINNVSHYIGTFLLEFLTL